MGIIPCEIPLLEFDPEQTAVIGPDYEQLDLHLPRKCVFAFLGGYIDRYAHAAGARQVATFIPNSSFLIPHLRKAFICSQKAARPTG